LPVAAGEGERHHGGPGRRGGGRAFPRLLVVRALPPEIRGRLSPDPGGPTPALVETADRPRAAPDHPGGRGRRNRPPGRVGPGAVLGRSRLLLGRDPPQDDARSRTV